MNAVLHGEEIKEFYFTITRSASLVVLRPFLFESFIYFYLPTYVIQVYLSFLNVLLH